MEIAVYAIPPEIAGKPSSLPTGGAACRRPSRRKTPSCRHRRTTARLRACLIIETPSAGDAFTLVAVSEELPMFT
uniref:Uncharacterized protein n=1 Tax=Oryza glaberrima TaxID=4538 RepID=A0A679BA17_ORYGL|nr:hypothetical protein [Oryza glaberrima]